MNFTVADSIESSFGECYIFNPIHEVFRTPENNGNGIQFFIICNIPFCALENIINESTKSAFSNTYILVKSG